MTTYQIVPISNLDKKQNSYPALNWPIDLLNVGEAFVVPLANGRDLDGRPEKHLRALALKTGQRLGRRFSCNKVQEGMAISRIA